jgi:hypothetical protein
MEWEGISTRSITTSPSTGSHQSSNHGLVTGNGHNLYRVKMSSAGNLIGSFCSYFSQKFPLLGSLTLRINYQ